MFTLYKCHRVGSHLVLGRRVHAVKSRSLAISLAMSEHLAIFENGVLIAYA